MQQNRDASIEAKKAKSEVLIPSTPETNIVPEPKPICSTCNSKTFIVDSSSLSIIQWKPVDQIKLGRDSRADTSYQYVLSMLPDEMVYEISHRLAQEMRNGNEDVTLEQLQK